MNNPLDEITVGNEVVPVETPKILIPAEDGTLEPGKTYYTIFSALTTCPFDYFLFLVHNHSCLTKKWNALLP